jgi:striatin 1/3/4
LPSTLANFALPPEAMITRLKYGVSTLRASLRPRESFICSCACCLRITLLTAGVCSARATTEIEPQLTLRGHSAAITRLVHAPSKHLLYSASLDSSIRVWALPTTSHTTYAPYDSTRARGELIGHTDAVWDLALVRDESTLVSCGAEGSVKVWDVSGPSGGGSLKLSWSYDGLESTAEGELDPENHDMPGATAVEAIKTDLKKVAAAYQNGVIKVFDIENGKEVMKLQPEAVEGVSLGLP